MDFDNKNSCARKIEGDVDSPGKRLLELLDYMSKTRTEIAKEAELSVTALSNYCSDLRPIGKKLLTLLAHKYGVSSDWLLHGEGEPFRGQTTDDETIESSSKSYEEECLRLKHQLADKDRELATLERMTGQYQKRIFEAVGIACQREGLSHTQTMSIQFSVMSVDLTSTPEAHEDMQGSHQKAVGDD